MLDILLLYGIIGIVNKRKGNKMLRFLEKTEIEKLLSTPNLALSQA